MKKKTVKKSVKRDHPLARLRSFAGDERYYVVAGKYIGNSSFVLGVAKRSLDSLNDAAESWAKHRYDTEIAKLEAEIKRLKRGGK